ncbi:S-layer homology domain-containing protein [Ancylothrix sp. D3o]|uniref:S-layer homology domain-containing protein n=1 Tax=Ancylothrix sp. D3o TaxID=2953691 RepID=UPI0021BAAF08|nr:S-layer homology domain-containing protein [Ancylothrix sp. D3o]
MLMSPASAAYWLESLNVAVQEQTPQNSESLPPETTNHQAVAVKLVDAKKAEPLAAKTTVTELLTSGTTHEVQPLVAQASTFPDIQGHWAQSFVEPLAARGIIRGFPDGTFRPEESVTRAQFAAIIGKAFAGNAVRNPIQFADVPVRYWAYDGIQQAYQIGFLEGYPNNTFNPEQNIPRVQVLVSLSNGLNLAAGAEQNRVLTTSFQDAAQIPSYALPSVAAAAENQLVVNYPDINRLRPNQNATRAETAALIYQALANAGLVPSLTPDNPATRYIAGYQPPQPTAQQPAPQPAPAPEDPASLRDELRIPIPQAALLLPSFSSISPGSSSGSPTAFGADYGNAFIGASFQARTRYTNLSDGAVSFGFGVGDAQKSVGLEVAVAVLDLANSGRGDPGTLGRGSVSFKLHRILPDDMAVAVGVENLLVWGGTDSGTSLYGVVSKVFRLQDSPEKPFSSLTASVGLGTGRFKSEWDFENGQGSVNVFGSLGLRVAEPVSLIADWTGQDLTLGASIVPFRNIPLVITPAFADITGNAGDGARFILGIGYSFPYSF